MAHPGDLARSTPWPPALDLASRARTDRERIKAAEAVRAATAVQVRALRGGNLDADLLEQPDSNVEAAGRLYREVGGFENELRALQGVREAIRHRLEAIRVPGARGG